EAGRDWWPLTMMWARRGEVPARAAVIARPSSAGEVAAVLKACNEARVPVTPVAGRSGVCGASVPVFGGVALDTTAMEGVVSVDTESLLLDVRPGTFGDDLEARLRDDYGVTLGHWPQSIALSTVGGWLACRSAGQYSTRYGKIEDMVVGLDVVLADGSAIHTGGRAPRAAVGPDLTQLFVGSEGTLGVITEASLRVHPVPPAEERSAWAFPSFGAGLEACRRILRRGATPAVLRLYDHRESKRSFDVEDRHVIVALDEGDEVLVHGVMRVVAEECAATGGERLDDALVERWLSHRNDVSGLGEAISRDLVVDTCEVAARWSVLPALYEEAITAVKAVPGTWVCSAHQSHAYTDGACLYFTFAGQRDDADAYYADAWTAITDTTIRLGGAISHHHGIGLNRGRFMADALGTAFPTLVAVKQALDPNGILNPGKLGLPSPFGPAQPWPPAAPATSPGA
ncbi:MAG TPA: FAD-binding oxidoreductase, partial [Acidimicrobiales bacterium]|nr:FAD-binding oxidoreductase [Acidimicrobiales bacterium]